MFTMTDSVIQSYPIFFQILTKDQVLGNDRSWWNSSTYATASQQAFQFLGQMPPLANKLANHTLGIFDTVARNPAGGEPYTATTLYNGLRTQNVYVHSSMQMFNSQGPGQGDSDIIAMIPVSAPAGSLITWQSSGSELDVFPLPNMVLQNIQFYLTDDMGQRLSLESGHVILQFKIYDP
jgi:hypothetical protein